MQICVCVCVCMHVCACFTSELFFFYKEREREIWRQGVGGRGREGGGVDARIPLRPRLPALSREEWRGRNRVHENKRGGSMGVRRERKQIGKYERQKKKLTRKLYCSGSEQLAKKQKFD